MIAIYTDASVSQGSGVATCLVISSDAFIGYNVTSYDSVTSSLHGELLGILDGIRYVKSCNLHSDDAITLYSDSHSAVSILRNNCNDLAFGKELIADIRKECIGLNIEFEVVKGHQSAHNPNKVVDLTSNTVLRYLLKSEVKNIAKKNTS